MSSERTRYEAVGGSVPGRAHARAGRNNQDAFAWRLEAGHAVAVVCDGCSEGARSEVGAALGAGLVVETISRALREDPTLARPAALLARAGDEVVAGLRTLADALGGDPRRTVADYLLFTVVGVAIGSERAACFAAGDGAIVLNGEPIRLGPFPDNAPPYLAYALLDEAPGTPFAAVRELAAADLQTVVLATDGAVDLELASFVAERYFRNPDTVRRRLAVAAREPGLLCDDTTLVALRRRPASIASCPREGA